jgi:hypothetical protein
MGEALLLTAKIKQHGKVYENGSRQIIRSIENERIRFCSGLVLSQQDGRVRQGDVVTTYKSQGSSKLDMIRFEDNQSLRAMAGQEELRVGFTRHRATARIFVESLDVLREIATRSQQEKPIAARLTQSTIENTNRVVSVTTDQLVNASLLPAIRLANEEPANARLQPPAPIESRDLVRRHRLRQEFNRCRHGVAPGRQFRK